jgi:hypothetical protein
MMSRTVSVKEMKYSVLPFHVVKNVTAVLGKASINYDARFSPSLHNVIMSIRKFVNILHNSLA